jgi:hypothetical protein
MTSTKTRRAAPRLLPGFLRIALCGTTALALARCGGGASTPTGNGTPPPITLQTPAPTPTPAPIPPLPAGMTCFPTPPPLYGIVVKIQVGTKGRKTLDSRPQVINMNGYGEAAGFGGGFFCFTRKEDDPQSVACDYMALGRASDTGRWGPTWSVDGKACTDNNEIDGCQNHPGNQFLAIAKGEGIYQACAADYIPLSTDARRPGSRCGYCRLVAGENVCQ